MGREKRVAFKDAALFYGHRPATEGLQYLSPFEFHMHWEVILAEYPKRPGAEAADATHAELTELGAKKLSHEHGEVIGILLPGIDYIVKSGGLDWVCFPDIPSTQHFRHEWVLRRRRRPVAPVFLGSPVPRHGRGTAERSAAIVMSYFHPWSLQSAVACDYVPLASALRPEGSSWQEVLAQWLSCGLLCEESKRHVSNFIAVHRMRPTDDDDDLGANSEDMVSDEELQVNNDNLQEALATKVGGRYGPRTGRDLGGDLGTEDVSHEEN